MVDIFTKSKRSWVMSRIRGKNTSIEKLVVRELRRHKLRFRQHYRIGPGTTAIDIAFPERKLAVYIDGDFWHGHDWLRLRRKLQPFWRKKIETNRKRDRAVTRRLKHEGWTVLRFWEHDVRADTTKVVATIDRSLRTLGKKASRGKRVS